MKKRNALAIMLALLLLFSLAGCSGGGSAADTTEQEVSSAAAEASSADASAGNDSEENAETAEAKESVSADVETTGSDADFQVTYLDDGTCEISGCFLTDAESIVVPDTIGGRTVTGIGGYAFSTLAAKEITLPDTVEYLSEASFVSCESLETINLGSGLKTIASLAITSCDSLTSLTFPDGMETIETMAFLYCENLGEVYIPDSVTNFGDVITFLDACPNVVIVTPAGSAAEAKATENALPVRNP